MSKIHLFGPFRWTSHKETEVRKEHSHKTCLVLFNVKCNSSFSAFFLISQTWAVKTWAFILPKHKDWGFTSLRLYQQIYLFIYLGFYVAFNTVQVISRRVVGRAEETSTYSSSGFCTVNCLPTASNYQLSHLRPCRELNPNLRGGRRECYHSATVAPVISAEATHRSQMVLIRLDFTTTNVRVQWLNAS